MITFPCRSCAQQLRVADGLIGKEVQCPKCGGKVLVAASVIEGTNNTLAQSAVDQDAATLPPTRDRLTVPPVPATSADPQPTISHSDDATLEPRPVHIPGYELLGELGRGGMGVVYKARHKKLHRLVALKMILAGSHAGATELARFQVEAEAIARLQHPNIVQVHEVGEHEGKPFFSLEFCGGGSLAQKLKGTPLQPGEAAALVETLAGAMQAAHDQKIIHRDLKPGNVLLTETGVPKITDFGLAKKLDEVSQTQSGSVMGTPSYMAPEQAVGESSAVGPLADVYTLGAILYECLSGRPPFKAATSLETMLQVTMDEPVPPRQLQSKTPKDLETICLKCLQKEPRKRYASAGALADDLARFRRGEPVLARSVGQLERTWRWCRREPALAGSLAAAFLFLVVGIVISSYLGIQAHENAVAEGEARQREADQRLKAEGLAEKEAAARKKAEDAERDALAKLWDSYLLQARGLRNSRRPGQRFATLRAINEALALPLPPGRSKDELRNEAIGALLLPDFEIVQEWDDAPPGSLGGFAMDANLERYARGDDKGNVTVRQVKGDVELWLLPAIPDTTRIPSYYGLDFSPDGRFFNQTANTPKGQRRRLWKLDGPRPVIVVDELYNSYAFSPDSRQFAVVLTDQSVRIYDLATNQEPRNYQPPKGAYHVRFNPRQPLLAVSHADGYWLLNLTTGEGRVAVTPDGMNWLDWHPDGKILAVSGDAARGPSAITLYDVDSGQPVLAPLEGHKIGGVMVRFNHAGDRLLSSDWYGIWRLWDTRTGQLLLTMPSGEISLCFSADDSLAGVGFSRSKVKLFRFQPGREVRTVVQRGKAGSGDYRDYWVRPIEPTGRLVAVSARAGMAVVDVLRGEEAALLPLQSHFIHAEPGGAMLTFGKAGLLRWPVAIDRKTGNRRYGPPGKISATGSASTFDNGSSADGLVLAIPNYSKGAKVVRLADKRVMSVGPQEDVRHAAVSPDGRWVVTGSHGAIKDAGAMVWDAQTGKQVVALPVGGGCCVRFSPDNKWLLTTGGGCRLWSVGDWQEGPPLGAGGGNAGPFSPDGTLLALQDEPGVVRLVKPATGKEVARITLPEPTLIRPFCFTADGTRLVCQDAERGALHIFDLQQIRAQLVNLDLDWDAPPYPTATAPIPEPVKIEVDGTDTSAAELNEQARRLIIGPVDRRNLARALQLAQESLKQQPANPLFLNTLGMVQYRHELYADAVLTLEKSLAGSRGQVDGVNLFVLSMCHARLDAPDKARDCFDRALKWWNASKGLQAQQVRELTALREEAEMVMGMK